MPIRGHSSQRPQPPLLSSVPCSPRWRRWRWRKRSLWRCWWCRRPGRPCGSCGGTCCSFPGQGEHQCRLHKSRRSECLRLGSGYYRCERISLQLLIETGNSFLRPASNWFQEERRSENSPIQTCDSQSRSHWGVNKNFSPLLAPCIERNMFNEMIKWKESKEPTSRVRALTQRMERTTYGKMAHTQRTWVQEIL